MTQREFAGLACKVLGVYMIMQGLNVLGNVAGVQAATPDPLALKNPLSIIFPFLFLIVFGILLWLFSDKLAGIMVKNGSQPVGTQGIKASDIQKVAFSVIGLWFLGNSLPKLVSVLTTMFSTRQFSNFGMRVMFAAAGPINQLIIGLGIFLGSQGLVKLVNTARHGGLRREEG